MNYNQKNILRIKNEKLYHTVKSLEYFYNEIFKDWFIKIQNISLYASTGSKSYEEYVETCYPELEVYDKKFLVEYTKMYDDLSNIVFKNGFNFKPEMNEKGLFEIDLIPIKE